MIEDDKRFYELSCKQTIHRKLKKALAKNTDRVYDREDLRREPQSSQEIEKKYENHLLIKEINRVTDGFMDRIKKVKKVKKVAGA